MCLRHLHTPSGAPLAQMAARRQEFLPIYVWKWDFKPLEGSMLVLVRTAHVLAVRTWCC